MLPAFASPLASLSPVYFSQYPPNGGLASRLQRGEVGLQRAKAHYAAASVQV